MIKHTIATVTACLTTIAAVAALTLPLPLVNSYLPWITNDTARVVAAGCVIGTFLCAVWLNDLYGSARRQKSEVERRMGGSLDLMSDSFFAVDHNWRFVTLNKQAAIEHGVTREDVLGKSIWEVFRGVAGTDFGFRLKLAMDSPEMMEFETCVDTAGTLFHVKAYPSGDGIAVAYQNLTEVRRLQHQLAERTAKLDQRNSELERANADLSALMSIDPLTGLRNHAAFQDHLKGEFRRSVRYSSELSVGLIDIDKFKAYNEHFGHSAGDELLRMIGRLLTEELRATDFVARYSGGQFAMVLPETDQQGAMELSERIRGKVEVSEWPLRGVTVSIGLASVDVDSESATAVIQEANQALYSSKSSGRNRVICHAEQPEIQKAA